MKDQVGYESICLGLFNLNTISPDYRKNSGWTYRLVDGGMYSNQVNAYDRCKKAIIGDYVSLHIDLIALNMFVSINGIKIDCNFRNVNNQYPIVPGVLIHNVNRSVKLISMKIDEDSNIVDFDSYVDEKLLISSVKKQTSCKECHSFMGDINSRDELGENATFRAAKNGHLLCLERLIACRGNVNCESKFGSTPVLWAR
jgi:hypothetical protein